MNLKIIRALSLIVTVCIFSEGLSEELATPDIEDIEYPNDEPPSAAEIALGKTLFFDPRLSLNHQQSCASCHNPDLGFSDGMASGIGTMGGRLERNTPQIYNLAWNSVFFWDGRASSLEEQALGPIEAGGEMNMPLDKLINRLSDIAHYRQEFTQVYGKSGITKENIGRAIAAYERTIMVKNTPFDKYLEGDKIAMSPAAIRGLELFKTKARCTLCHDGANFTDNGFHNIGIKGNDPGRAPIIGDNTLKGAFKTPGLRNILLSPPYMHDGSLVSLEEVIRFYNRGGEQKENLDKLIKPLNLSEAEIFDLLAFLGALNESVDIKRPPIP